MIRILLGSFFLFLFAVSAVRGQEREREPFEISCPSIESAIDYITEADYNGCYNFEERYGFKPLGFLDPILDWGDKTVYFVDWGNGATGVYAVK